MVQYPPQMKVFNPLLNVVLAPFRFLQQVLKELQQVTWPTRKQTVQSTAIVILFSVLVGLYISGIDFLAVKALDLIITR